MIQKYGDLKNQISQFKHLIQENGQIQKIYSTPHFLIICIRNKGKSWCLYIGKGGGYEGIWISHKNVESKFRCRDRFLEYSRKKLSGTHLTDIVLDDQDRIIKIGYLKFGKPCGLYVFWSGRTLYFMNIDFDQDLKMYKIFTPWSGETISMEHYPTHQFDYFNSVGRINLVDKSPSLKLDQEIQKLIPNLYSTSPLKLKKFLKRKRDKILGDLNKADDLTKLDNLLKSETSLMNNNELLIGSQKIKFTSQMNNFQRKNIIFEKIKKLKKGKEILLLRLKSVENEIEKKGEIQVLVLPSSIEPVWGTKKNLLTPKEQITKEEFKIHQFQNYKLAIGLNRFGNDQLRIKWASKEDLWFHLGDGLKSAHLIVKFNSQVTKLNEHDYNLIGSLLAKSSQFNDEWIPLIYTKVKYLQGVPKHQGMVRFKNQKNFMAKRINLEGLEGEK